MLRRSNSKKRQSATDGTISMRASTLGAGHCIAEPISLPQTETRTIGFEWN